MGDENIYTLTSEDKKQFAKIISDTGKELIAKLDKEFPTHPVNNYSVRNMFLRLSAMKSIQTFAKTDYDGAIEHWHLDPKQITEELIVFKDKELQD